MPVTDKAVSHAMAWQAVELPLADPSCQGCSSRMLSMGDIDNKGDVSQIRSVEKPREMIVLDDS